MSGLFGALEIGKRGLMAGQTGLSITGQNIANANTPGYSRKVMEQSPLQGPRLAEGYVGAGVDVVKITRARDEQLEGRLLRARADLGDSSARAAGLREVESTLGDLEEGSLSDRLAEFLGAWDELAVTPESVPLRQAVRLAGETLATTFNRLGDGIARLRTDLARRVPQEIAGANERIARIAELSKRIGMSEGNGQQANDLRDDRGREIDALAGMLDVNFTEAPNGSFLLRVGGVVVADGERSLEITLENGTEGFSGSEPVLLSVGGARLTPAAGSIGASLDLANRVLPGYLTRLDEIAQGLADSVNAIHENAVGLDGGKGGAFFDVSGAGAPGAGSGAASWIRLSDAVRSDPRAIAASANGTSGDNAAARAIADLGGAKTLRGATRSVAELTLEFVQDAAGDASQAAFLEEARGAFVDTIQNRRDAVSGVSLDEEAINLVKFQQAYQASARLIATANQMMDTLFSEI